MPDFNIRSDSVNVEQIMEQIRARIREKRGVDYTEEEIRELAAVKLEKFLDPRGVRSDLLEQFRKAQPPDKPVDLPNYAFDSSTLFDSHRAIVRIIRRLLLPILKLFFNPNPLIQALHIQADVNRRHAEQEAADRASHHLYYELIHNLVVETTRLAIEVKNLKMRVESVGSRLEFNERRARALESVVVYKPSGGDVKEGMPPAGEPSAAPATQEFSGMAQPSQPLQPGEGPGQRSRRRRRRRGRRTGASAATMMAGQSPVRPHDDAGPPESAKPTDQVAQDDFQNVSSASAHRTEPLGGGSTSESHPPEPAADSTPENRNAVSEAGPPSGTDAGLPGRSGPGDDNGQ
jgi:hypothetical protein